MQIGSRRIRLIFVGRHRFTDDIVEGRLLYLRLLKLGGLRLGRLRLRGFRLGGFALRKE